jgi:hypothetical protein
MQQDNNNNISTGKLFIWQENNFFYIGFDNLLHRRLSTPKKYIIRKNDESHALIPTNAILRGFSAHNINGLTCIQIADSVMNLYRLEPGQYTAGLWHDMIIF